VHPYREIERHQVADVVGEDRPQGCDGAGRGFAISRETVRSATSIPSFGTPAAPDQAFVSLRS